MKLIKKACKMEFFGLNFGNAGGTDNPYTRGTITLIIERMSFMRKRLISLLVCLTIVMSVTIPLNASAATDNTVISPMMAGNGYTSDEFSFNGQFYFLYITSEYNSSLGARTKAWSTLYDEVDVSLSDVSVRYEHRNYKSTTEVGGKKSAVEINAARKQLYSGYVPSRYGMSQVTNYRSISGTAFFEISNGIEKVLSVYESH